MLGDALRRQPEFVDALGDDDALAAENDPRRARRRGARHARVAASADARRATGSAGSSGASCCASRARDLLGFAPLEDDRTRAHRARRGVPRGRARPSSPPLPVRGDRHGPARRRASSRTRPTSTCCSSTTATDAADFDDAETVAEQLIERDRRHHLGRSDLPHRRPPPARGQAGPARPLARRVTRAYYERWAPDVGAPGAHSRRASSPATPTLGERFCGARRAVRVPATRSPTTTSARSAA